MRSFKEVAKPFPRRWIRILHDWTTRLIKRFVPPVNARVEPTWRSFLSSALGGFRAIGESQAILWYVSSVFMSCHPPRRFSVVGPFKNRDEMGEVITGFRAQRRISARRCNVTPPSAGLCILECPAEAVACIRGRRRVPFAGICRARSYDGADTFAEFRVGEPFTRDRAPWWNYLSDASCAYRSPG